MMSGYTTCILLVWLNVILRIAVSAPPDHGGKCTLEYEKITPLMSNITAFGEDLGIINHGKSSTVRLFRTASSPQLYAVKQFGPVSLIRSDREDAEACIKLEYRLSKIASGLDGVADVGNLLHDPQAGLWWITSVYQHRSLASEIHNFRTSDVERLAYELVKAIHGMHLRGIVFNDVKLENVLLDAEGRALLIDFGSASFAGCMESTVAINVKPCGGHTPPYASPQAWESHTYNRLRNDVWSLGILLYVLSTKEMPWKVATNESLAWCRFAGIPDGLRSTCITPGAFGDTPEPTCSLHGLPRAHEVPGRLQGVIWGFLEIEEHRRLTTGAALIMLQGG